MLKFLKTMNLIVVLIRKIAALLDTIFVGLVVGGWFEKEGTINAILPLLLCFCLSSYILTTVAEYFVEKSKCQ